MGRKGDHGGHHGGGWKVAAADFFCSMMALFIVLWILGSSKETQAAVAAYFNHPSILKGEGSGFLSKEGMIELKRRGRRSARRRPPIRPRPWKRQRSSSDWKAGDPTPRRKRARSPPLRSSSRARSTSRSSSAAFADR